MDFYRSREWRELTKQLKLMRVNAEGFNVCEFCGGVITSAYDCICHHVIELNERNVNDVSIALNPDNIQLVHHKCHNKIHNKLGVKERQVYLVWGSPCSGKTTWVNEVKLPGDLIVDIDSIWECISGCDRYIKPTELTSNVFSIRDTLYEHIRYRLGNWDNAYVIGGYPLISERERLCKTLNARDVFIDTDKEVCMLRAESRKGWSRYVEEWWDRFIPPQDFSENF